MNMETIGNIFKSLVSCESIKADSEIGEGVLQVLEISDTHSRRADTVRQVLLLLRTIVFFSIAFAVVKVVRIKNEYKTFR